MYLITIENSLGDQHLIDEIFGTREMAKSRVECSDSRFCYYYIYKIEMINNRFEITLTDKIWNFP